MVAVISDVHGCLNTITELYNEIKLKFPLARIYCVGDLVDRGNFSADTIDFCMKNDIEVCMGNHDYMFYHYFLHPDSSAALNWTYNGHMPTLKSYNRFQMEFSKHLDYVSSLKLFFNTEDCFISHAGVSKIYKKYFKDYSLDGKHDDFINQLLSKDLNNDHSVIWERDTLLKLDKLQVVGHTRKMEVAFVKDTNTYYIDTSCVYGNKLTAIIVEKNQVIDKLEIRVKPEDIGEYNY